MASRFDGPVRQALRLLLPYTVLSTVMLVAAYRKGLAAGSAATDDAADSRSDKGDNRAIEASPGTEMMDDDGDMEDDVERVLDMWFGGATADNHRTKWFAQGDNVARIDARIRDEFGGLVHRAEIGALTVAWSKRPHSLVALILLLDQFSRHLFREYPDRDERVGVCDRQALTLTETLLQRGWQHKLTAEQHVFALMPLRHTPSEDRLLRVLDEVNARDECLQHAGELIQRFRKATNRRLQGIQDRAEEGAEILEHFEFEPADPSKMDRHELVKVLRAFLDQRGGVAAAAETGEMVENAGRNITSVKSDNHCDREVSNTGKDSNADSVPELGSDKTGRSRTVAVSLSGGVDSMALCMALVHLKPVYGFDVMGIHIDYGNRHESGREADFVEEWCARHGVVFYKRAIAEVKRGVTARDEYEKIARDIRFNAYKSALEERGEGACPTVMFGHHEGDVEENVLTNLVKGCSILGLAGMLPENTVNGVRVWRPMLPFGKAVVYDFAHKFGVPYFKDTTPSWSTRGKLRRQLIPMMEDVFGAGVLNHLSSVARESDDLRELVHRELFQPVWDAAVIQPLGLHLHVEPYRGHGLLFWKEVLRELVHSLGMPMIRDKTLGMFVRDTLQKDMHLPLKEKWVELRKEYVGVLHEGSLFIFRMGVFLPPNTSYGEQASGTPVPVDGAVVDVGPWRITTVEGETIPPEELQDFVRGRPPAANMPPFTSMEELMGGKFSYVLAVPDTPDAELTVQPGARAKASAWLEVDPRIRRGLPLVAPAPTREKLLLKETGAKMVTVTLRYTGKGSDA